VNELPRKRGAPMGRVIAAGALGLLIVPAGLFALGSLFLLDIPWAGDGLGALMVWLVIVDAWVFPCMLALAVKHIWIEHVSFSRAILLPLSAIVAHFLIVGATYLMLQRCIMWCSL
jgi:hypothetical protein